MPRFAFLAVAATLLLIVLGSPAVPAIAQSAESDWRITNFEARYDVLADGSVHVTEEIDANFASYSKHGIFRDLDYRIPCQKRSASAATDADPSLFSCASPYLRVYTVSDSTIDGTVVNGVKPDVTHPGENFLRIRFGDPSTTVHGPQHYHLSYDIGGALNPFTQHDELYWNATGLRWPVPMDKVTVLVSLPPGTALKAVCYEGLAGSDRACNAVVNGSTATFTPKFGSLGAFQGLTFAVAFPKGSVAVQPPTVEKDFTAGDLFTLDWIEYAGVIVAAVAGLFWLFAMWWRFGRDRRFRTIGYLNPNAPEETTPLFANKDIVVEYTPPDGLRPGQMGVLLDEKADALDVTATIVDLAVRGYLQITEIPKHGLFGHKDWKLTKGTADDSVLLAYEAQLYRYLFANHNEIELSKLKNTFATKLKSVENKLYADANQRKWFDRNPETARAVWLGVGIGVFVVGVAVAAASGFVFGRLLIGVPIAVAGLLMIPLSFAMARRTATGHEALRRVLGFRLYVSTAETRKQEFNEKQNIFAQYLPYAIVFHCVDKWAKAFDGIDNEAVSGWYVGSGVFNALVLSSALNSFSSVVSSNISSTPGSSGGSGFSGGSSGGGGGGGGGGSW